MLAKSSGQWSVTSEQTSAKAETPIVIETENVLKTGSDDILDYFIALTMTANTSAIHSRPVILTTAGRAGIKIFRR